MPTTPQGAQTPTALRIGEDPLRKLIFETFGHQRFTQDSPVMPSVWLKFARYPGTPIDLLLTPSPGSAPGALAGNLSEKLSRYHGEEDPEVRLRGMEDADMLVALAGPSAGRIASRTADDTVANSRARFDVAYGRSSVVARLTFQELVHIVVPMTEWWSRLPAQVRSFESLRRIFSDARPGDTIAHAIGAATSRVVQRYSWDFFRFCALVGFIHQAAQYEAEIAQAGDARRARGIAGDRARRLSVLAEALTKDDSTLKAIEPIIDGYESMAGRIIDPETPPPGKETLRAQGFGDTRVRMVSENRPTHLSLVESRAAVKADAAQNVFRVDASGLAWAVIDGGIDARHPAFLWRSRASTLARKAGRPSVEDLAKEDIPTEHLARLSRVRETYDFTYLRRMLAIKDLPSPEEGGPVPELAEFIRARHRVELNHLRIRTVKGREIDWGIVAPLIRVPHDANYRKPPVAHGTHVAGILAGDWRAGDNPEDCDLIGVCPEIELYDLRVFNPRGGAAADANHEFTVLYALQFVQHLNRSRDAPAIHGVNLSLSMLHDVMSFACGRTPVCEECNELVGAGVVVVAAAGNEGYKTFKVDGGDFAGYHATSITDPGNAEGVITVGSTHRAHPHNYGVSYFSSRGPTGDGRRKPDLVAPGEKITAPVPDCGVQRMDGTSMAAPHVSGAAALLMARHRELIGSPRRIKEILCRTATDLGREPHFQGAGMLDILRAIQSV